MEDHDLLVRLDGEHHLNVPTVQRWADGQVRGRTTCTRSVELGKVTAMVIHRVHSITLCKTMLRGTFEENDGHIDIVRQNARRCKQFSSSLWQRVIVSAIGVTHIVNVSETIVYETSLPCGWHDAELQVVLLLNPCTESTCHNQPDSRVLIRYQSGLSVTRACPRIYRTKIYKPMHL